MRWDIILERQTKNRLNPETTRKILRDILRAAERNKETGFAAQVGRLEEPREVFDADNNQGWHYRVRCRLREGKARTRETAERRFQYALELLRRRAESREWSVRPADDGAAPPAQPQVVRGEFAVPDLTPAALAEHFAGVYERDAHVRLVHDSVRTFVSTGRRIRGHTLLYGLPAGCKTTLFERFKGWYDAGQPVERVGFVDGPTMSKAGLENWLLAASEDGTLPDILVVEEIEKQPLDNLLTLLSVMGSGYVAKLNARVQARRPCPCLVWGTCNDPSILKNFRNGALWSRFAHRWYCARPSRDLMGKILRREVDAIGGDPAWVAPVMTFAYDVLGLEDPREIISLLDGRERLLTGEYQEDVLAVRRAEQIEKAEVFPSNGLGTGREVFGGVGGGGF